MAVRMSICFRSLALSAMGVDFETKAKASAPMIWRNSWISRSSTMHLSLPAAVHNGTTAQTHWLTASKILRLDQSGTVAAPDAI